MGMYLITGATGTVGRPLVELLVAAGAPVRAVSRTPSAAALPPGVDVVAEPDFTDVTAVFLHPRAVGLAAADLLAGCGARKVVVLTASNVDDPVDEQPSRFAGDRNKEVEAAALASGLEWVSLRAGYFAINTAYSWAAQLRAGDVVHAPFPHASEAPLDERDLAAVAAHALTTDDLVGEKLVLTGPEALTHTELVAAIGDVLDRPLRFAEVPLEAAARGLVAHGHSEAFASALMARYQRENGRPAHVSGDVAKVLGRAGTFRDWVAANADLFARTTA